jgi:zinc and cadmium transporter
MIYALISVIIVSLISIIIAMPFIIKKRISNQTLIFLLSISVGVLLSTVFMDFIPEIAEHGYNLNSGIYLLSGFILMFIIEKFIHYHHSKRCEDIRYRHSHTYSVAPINLIGDGIHNFIDGLVIAGSYAVNISVGIASTISIIFHEIPQEIADFGVLLYSGLSKKKALLFNFFSAISAIIGAIVGFILIKSLENFISFIIPFAAGNFIYIAASNLLPQLHRHCKLKDTLIHTLAIIIGIVMILAITVYVPGHGH